MIDLIKEHWFISILGTIFLGALGSGVWEAALKPTFQYIGKYAFTILSFGAKKASDNIYIDAARGHHEVPSLYVFFNITLFLICKYSRFRSYWPNEAKFDDRFSIKPAIRAIDFEISGKKPRIAAISARFLRFSDTLVPLPSGTVLRRQNAL